MSEKFKDSGTRRDFGTGAVRDAAGGKGRFDLLPFDAIQQLAMVLETGCQKYGDRNWEKGIPVYTFLDSGSRHLHKAMSGWTDEPHLAMAFWNLACAIQTCIWVRRGQRPSTLAYAHEIRLCGDADSEGAAKSIEIEKAPDPEDQRLNAFESLAGWKGLFPN